MSIQRNLFETAPEPWEIDDQELKRIATVVVAGQPVGELDYLVPDTLAEHIEPGRRVRVPLGKGNRLVDAYCVCVEVRPVGPRKLKSVDSVLDTRSLLKPAMIQLTRWIAEHYLCDLGAVLEAVIPSGVRGQAGTRMATLLSAAPDAIQRAAELKLTSKQAGALAALIEAGKALSSQDLMRAAGVTEAPIGALRAKGLIVAHRERQQTHTAVNAPSQRQAHLELNPDQKAAFEAVVKPLRAGEYRTILIHGVTGSGKTEVYIHAIDEAVRGGRQAIVLVPEISLTPQTVERFRSRFGEVAVLHSHLSDSERHWHWQRIADGLVRVIVGARSAIFAPAPRLGLIVLDEEQEGSFKQETAPRYHARDVAIARAKLESIPLVLGSATPSLESWQRARTGEFLLVEMPRRVMDLPLPAVGTIDLRTNRVSGMMSSGAISRQLVAAISAALNEGGQVILLLNRRGYSTHIQCPACGHVVRCPNCDIALTHHRQLAIALCHYCDHEVPAPPICPECQFTGIRYNGLGTQRLEAEVRARFPGAAVLRMDTDTMQGAGAHERALGEFRAGKVRILLGTQMIAKGLDFPNVTLVGVINADTALHLPDFRASERTFQLVTQVAGRTGRSAKGGRVIVQTFSPDHPAIRAAVEHNYRAFADGELPIREMLRYPPFAGMIRLVIRGPNETITAEFARQLGDRILAATKERQANARVLGPAPAPFARLRGLYRFQIHVHGQDLDLLRASVRAATTEIDTPQDVQWIVDVDPLDML